MLTGEDRLIAPHKQMGGAQTMSLSRKSKNRAEVRPLVKISADWSQVEIKLRVMSLFKTFSWIK
jgi:hypothetical protein